MTSQIKFLFLTFLLFAAGAFGCWIAEDELRTLLWIELVCLRLFVGVVYLLVIYFCCVKPQLADENGVVYLC